MIENTTKIVKKIDFAGRVLIPVSIRDELCIKENDNLIIKTVILDSKKYILLEKEGE